MEPMEKREATVEKILIVDDDRAIGELVSDALADEGYETILCRDGAAAQEAVRQNPDVSLILLDIMMPRMNGLELCRRIRDVVSCPIIFVTAKSKTIDTLLGLEMGADDYIAKPFVVEELVARVKAHLRRENRSSHVDQEPDCLAVGDIRLYAKSYEVFLKGERVELIPREFQLLEYFMRNQGNVLTREQIFNGVWGMNYGDIGTVTVNIKNLRKKIDPDSRYIKTVWGVGYKFVKPTEDLDEA